MTLKIEAGSFWENVGAPNKRGCREWKKSLMKSGYGQVRRRGKTYTTHRFSYLLTHGVIPDGLCVLHKCDNRKCCNPDHLFLGTHQDNHDDMIAKGRKRWTPSLGSKQVAAKLREEDVIVIRDKLASGERGKDVAAQFGVSPSAVSLIKRGKGWRHV